MLSSNTRRRVTEQLGAKARNPVTRGVVAPGLPRPARSAAGELHGHRGWTSRPPKPSSNGAKCRCPQVQKATGGFSPTGLQQVLQVAGAGESGLHDVGTEDKACTSVELLLSVHSV